jgi:hypothetical protein
VNQVIFYTLHNTLLPFIERKEISPDGENAILIGIAPGLSTAQQKKAADTITLFKWDDIDTRHEMVD